MPKLRPLGRLPNAIYSIGSRKVDLPLSFRAAARNPGMASPGTTGPPEADRRARLGQTLWDGV
jgi:hypothetical protein